MPCTRPGWKVIGLDSGEVESGSFWVEFPRRLKKRGLSGVRGAISDQHEGAKHALARVMGCPWHRCNRALSRRRCFARHCERAARRCRHCRVGRRGIATDRPRDAPPASGSSRRSKCRPRAGHLIVCSRRVVNRAPARPPKEPWGQELTAHSWTTGIGHKQPRRPGPDAPART